MSHVNKVQLIRLKMICIAAIRVDMYEESCIGCENTAESFLFLFNVSLPPQPALPHVLT
jgi:hypothetical protein